MMFWINENDVILYRDVGNDVATRQRSSTYENIADTRSVCVHVGILVNRHKKSRNEEKASGITRYEPSELYNALDTIVALEESSADASFFQAKICYTFGRIFLYKRKFMLQRVRKWLIHHYAAYFLRTKKNSLLICSSEHVNGIFNFGLYYTTLSFILVK